MRVPRSWLFLITAAWSFTIGLPLSAQGPIPTPRDSSKASFNGSKISVLYGKPSVRGRRIFGDVVPYYKVWRTGAGEATLFHTDVDLEMDGAVIPRGDYSIFTIPSEHRWKLIINKQTGQWGTEYRPEMDLARIDVEARPLQKTVEECSIRVEKTGMDAGLLRIEWDRTAVSVPFRVSADHLVASPRDSSSLRLGEALLQLDYGRPSMRGRTVFGGIVPYGSVWRTGANAATSLTISADVQFGGKRLPKGAYTLFTIPGAREWQVIVNTQTGQWGTVYDAKKDLFRVRVKRKATKEVTERLTIELRNVNPDRGELTIAWEKTKVVVPIEFSKTKGVQK